MSMSIKRAPVDFFSLPLEIREQIYYLVLRQTWGETWSHEVDVIHLDLSLSGQNWSEVHQVPGFMKWHRKLLHINRQMYEEASTVLYRDFIFSFEEVWSAEHLKTLRRWLSSPLWRRIRNIRVVMSLRQADKTDGPYKWEREALDVPPSLRVLGENLPELKNVYLEVHTRGRAARDLSKELVLQRAIDFARPFRAANAIVFYADRVTRHGRERELLGELNRRICAGEEWW